MYSGFAQASRKALEREDECKVEFHKVKKIMEDYFEAPSSGAPPEGASVTASKTKKNDPKYLFTDVILPCTHLTSVTFPSFRTFVEKHHPGWKVIRRTATKEDLEALQPGQRNTARKGKSFFIGFSYQKDAKPWKPRKAKRKAAELEEDDEEATVATAPTIPSPDAKKAKVSEFEEDKKPAALSSRSTTFDGFSKLPEQLQGFIAGYCDVKTLGSLLFVNKSMNRVVKHDDAWKPHLKHLLGCFFDGSISFKNASSVTRYGWPNPSLKDPAVPLTEREDWYQVRETAVFVNNNVF
ncbi:MAG: hypothetical protein SGARI_002361, partial [Bacillariaceae sp.]